MSLELVDDIWNRVPECPSNYCVTFYFYLKAKTKLWI